MTQDVNGQRHDRTALILYGSETGNAQDVAEELGRLAERLHFLTRVCEMDAVELNVLLRFTIVVFVTSTTGQGEFPKNAQKFWRSLLRKRLPPDCLSHVHFTTFGLGDSSYAQFNYAARKLHKRLEQVGAQEIYPRGEADERNDEGIDGTFLSWSADFRKHLLSIFPLQEGVFPIPPDVILPPKILLSLREEATGSSTSQDSRPASQEAIQRAPAAPQDPISNTDPFQPDPTEPLSLTHISTPPNSKMLYTPYASPEGGETKPPENPTCPMLKEEYHAPLETFDSKPTSHAHLPIPDGVPAKLIENKRITPESHWQDVRLLKFVVEAGFDYFVGDTMTIYPKNFPEDVQAVIDLMGWNAVADKPLVFNNTLARHYEAEMAMNHVPEGFVRLPNSTLRDLLTHNFDITAIPKRHFFELAANHTDDPVHKLRLQEFASPAYTDEYYDYATRPRRSILEVLQDFPTVKFPFQWALAVFPIIRGRVYSICSSGSQKNEDDKWLELQILVAMVKYKTVLKKVRQGLCSRYLASLPVNNWITCTLSVTKMTNPWVLNSENADHISYPAICVAPGTGIAPVRALIWQRAWMEYSRINRLSDVLDRAVGRTYVFFGGRNKANDFFFEEEYNERSLMTTVYTAFSRDQPEKRYVQDVLRENGQLMAHLIINKQARIFVCGSSGNMPKAVREAFIDIIEKWDKDENGNSKGRQYAEALVADLVRHKRYTQETW